MRRRELLRVSAFVGAGTLTGCLNSSGDGEPSDVPGAVDLSGGKSDDRGGMVIGDHGGPNGQVFYTDNSPEGRDNPAWFHTLVFGLFPYHFERLNRGWEAEAVYVTDYSTVELSLSENEERPLLPSPTAPDTFADATELTYVAESTALGGMGPALPPFSDEADAEEFADEYGGRTVAYDEIDRQFIESLRLNAPGRDGTD
ncbi:MAG: nitrous oxide reductase accessory protein NosL [Halobacteriales archaeon]|nr:nitrous oxide reductase accessory protein NosL [Halobacteriales archaeon]